jgi:hypothetical protein
MGESNPEKPSVSIIEIHATSSFIRGYRHQEQYPRNAQTARSDDPFAK